ncbi:uncharacterized protein LOC130629680 [Hydractinia symbiolongicarpus]|uniref:uncharacterized protein LOC130629680 n=1 Tax=Hydractinia symbiolongicarpus TaxID=13093 RepID=UPI0025510193|nr:uncharacterized protein LOC130629680 [Hydractinia symbiolongicarpus]
MNLKSILNKLIKSRDVTPLPWTVVVVLFFIMILDKMIVTMVFSFLPKLVKSFGTFEADTGYYVGIIASAMSIGQTFFSLFWGYMADVKGKKPTLIVSTVATMLSTLAFGFTYNFEWAVTTRFLQGAATAIIVISKSIMADLCDNSNMPLAMTILSSTSAVGLIIGPSVAGFVVFSSEQYPDVFSEDSIFGRFGILLPNLILAIGFAIGVILITLFLPKCSNMKECTQVSFLNTLYGIATFANYELFPLYAATSAKYHGMSFSTSDIGLLLLIVSACFLPTQLLLTSRIIRCYGSRKVFIGGNLLLAFVSPWTPILVEIISNRTGWWIAVAFALFIQHLCMSTGYVTLNILINNTVTADLMGSANGLAMIFLSLGRIIAPIAIGSIYSWSLTNIKDVSSNTDPIGFPFNQYFCFFILLLLFTSNAIFASTLSPTLDNKKIIHSQEDDEQGCSTC